MKKESKFKTRDQIISFLIAGLLWGSLISEDAIVVSIFSVMLMAAGMLIIQAVVKYRKDLELKNTIESIYVVGLKRDGSRIDIPEQFEHLVFHVPRQYIKREAARLRSELDRVGNPFRSEDLPGEKRIHVIPIYPNDGIHVNQTDVEYNIMALDDIKDFRSEWHKILKDTDPEWYEEYHHHQV